MAKSNQTTNAPLPEDQENREQETAELKSQEQPNDTAEAVASTLAEAENRDGDAFGYTESPSPAMQADLVSQEVNDNGTVTDVPSKRLDKEALKNANGQ